MKRLYQAANLPQARLLADRLEAAGLEIRIFNANAQGIAGETPVTETLPEISLPTTRISRPQPPSWPPSKKKCARPSTKAPAPPAVP